MTLVLLQPTGIQASHNFATENDGNGELPSGIVPPHVQIKGEKDSEQ